MPRRRKPVSRLRSDSGAVSSFCREVILDIGVFEIGDRPLK